MKVTARVKGADKLIATLKKKASETKQDGKSYVIVGYSAPYAMAVHESVGMVLEGEPRPSGIGKYWGPRGQAKFLEQPARQYAKDMGAFVLSSVKSGLSITKSMFKAGQILLRESKKLVPVEYGDLKASGFVKIVEE